MNRSLTQILCTGALFLAAAGAASADPLVAGGTYQEYTLKECSGVSCQLDFSTVPLGKTLIITDINCTFATNAGAKPYGYSLVSRKPTTSGIRRSQLPLVIQAALPSSTYFTGQAEVRHIVVGGDKPTIGGLVYGVTGTYTPNCTISGELR